MEVLAIMGSKQMCINKACEPNIHQISNIGSVPCLEQPRCSFTGWFHHVIHIITYSTVFCMTINPKITNI